MLDILINLKKQEYDAYMFLPAENHQIHLSGYSYIDPGTPVGQSEMGKFYDIMLFKESEELKVKGLDLFSAVLLDPLEYMSEMIKNDWYGVITRKTTTSNEFTQKMFDIFKEAC